MRRDSDIKSPTKEQFSTLRELLGAIFESPSSAFYRTVWGEAFAADGVSSCADLTRIPTLSLQQLHAVPLTDRLYKTERLLTKITYPNGAEPLLIARRVDDICHEVFGAGGIRPLVDFQSHHEALEKSLWYYEQNLLPLINEADPRVTAALAVKYEVDAITTSTDALRVLLPELALYCDTSALAHVSIIDTMFSLPTLKKLLPDSAHRLVLALPEAGTIAVACPEYIKKGDVVFHPHKSSIVEIQNEKIVLTRLVMLPTPIVRYETDLSAQWTTCSCQCGVPGFVRVTKE